MTDQLTRVSLSLVFIALGALSACQTPPEERVAPAPSLDLLDAAPFKLADGCEANGSFIVEFMVDRQGRTRGIEPPSASPCVQDALTAWVASFRYSPPQSPSPGSIEWLLVSARKGS